MTAFHTSGGGVKYAWHKAFAYFRLILPWMGKVPKADGVIQLTLSNPSSSLALSLAVYKFISLAGFTCWLGKAEQLPLLWGGRRCVSIAKYRFGEGVHPVRVNTRHCEGGKCNGLVSVPTSLKVEGKKGKCNGLVATPTSMEGRCKKGKCNGLVATPTSMEGRCKRGKCNGLVSQPTRHCEVCEARRGNPVEQHLNLLDCFTTFAMTVIRHSEGVFYPTYQLVLTLPIEVHLPLRRVSLLMLRGFFAPLCSALNDKIVTNFFNFTFKLAFNLPANIFTPSTFQLFNQSYQLESEV